MKRLAVTSILICLVLVAGFFVVGGVLNAQQQPRPRAGAGAQSQKNAKRVTAADRKAAASRASAAGLQLGAVKTGLTPTPGGTPDYFGPYPNYANSPLPTVYSRTVVSSPSPTFYFAEGTTRPNFDPYISIQNPGSKNASVKITYMKGDGTTATDQVTVPAHSRLTVQPRMKLGTGDDAAHDFSAKVECTNGQKIVAERSVYFNYKPGEKDWNGGHDVIGATAPASTYYFAEGTTRPNFDPYITIQNPGTKTADVKITYMKGDETTATEQITVNKNSRFTVQPRMKLGTDDDAAHDFSAKVECTNGQKIVAERPMYFNYKPGERNWNGGHDVVGTVAPASAFYFAEGTTRPNFDPYFTIQNPGGTNAEVKITYMKGDGSSKSQSVTVPGETRGTVHPADVLGTGDDAAHDFSAKVECTNGQKIIAERPMYFNYKSGEKNWNGGHDVVGATAPASNYFFAEGTTRPNFDPYICIQNPGSKNANVRITYMKGDGSTATDTFTIAKQSRLTVQPRIKLGTGDDAAHDFSATVECTNGQTIVAERPMYFNYKPGERNWNGGHDVVGFSFTSTVKTVQAVVSGTGIRKFVDSLPGLGAANANDLGQYIPVAVPDTTSFPGSDYYEIELGQYHEKLHKDLPATTLRGYRQTNTSDAAVHKFSYLGPAIIAQKGRPVRVKFTDSLPTGAGGNLFIPVDTTIMGAGMGPLGMGVTPGFPVNYTQNRAVLHLHGGNTPWISDGTMHQWITPAGESTDYPRGVSVQNVPDMPDPGPGSQTFYYTNQQSARLMFYHDHAYGITRLNVYAGEAAPYLVGDAAEKSLVNSRIIPADQIPLVIQDKTFVPDDAQLTAEDPTWDKTKWGGKGNLWLPHVYMPNQNPGDVTGSSAMGRWDYGPWFWPPYTGLVNGPVANPYYDPANAPWEPPMIPGTPNPSLVPEAFMDTPVVNGTAYPFVTVGQKAYRFRILNACNDRTLNLQLYFAKSDGTMWNLDGTLKNGNAGEVKMVAADPGTGLPSTWPTDGRDGGVPDPKAAGPNFVQIGNEGGFLPQAAELPNTPVGYEYFRRSITVLNVSNKTLFMGPAERADVIVDFSKVPDGSKLILYNDAPTPVPAFDARFDYYTGDPDQTSTGGAPTTVAGYGPNTRTIMQFQVSSKITSGLPNFSLNRLKRNLPAAYAKFQAKPIVPQAAYNAAFGKNFPTDAYARIEDTTMTFFPSSGTLTNLTLTNRGSGYTSAPNVAFSGGGGTGAAATAQISGVTSVAVTAGGNSYTLAPTVNFSGGGGTGAAATAQISGVTSIAVTNGGSGYMSAPTVQFTDGGGSSATAVAVLTGDAVTSVNVTNGGSGYSVAPGVTFTGGGGSGAIATATVDTGGVTGVIVTNSGSNYTSGPGVTFTGGGGTSATASNATIQLNAVTGLTLTNPGSGYTSAPTVGFSGGGGLGAAATVTPLTMNMQPKAIQELFDPVYGRMNATLGVELPFTNITNQTTIPYFDIDPPSEVIKNSDTATPIGALADGTQIWKITHNGVDTHAIHWHMFNVQLINRVGWDGMVKPPDANELGWKETVRMNPLEDVIVALRPIIPNVPFDIPNSNRPLDPTTPLTSTQGFTNVDPSGQPATVANHVINYGWEYVWHCHLLGHEENIMMRPMAIAVAPNSPTSAAATAISNADVQVAWNDNSLNEKQWTVQRADSANGPWTTLTLTPIATTSENTTGTAYTYHDTTVIPNTTYYYRVIATNVVGDTTAYTPPAAGYSNMSVDSPPADTGAVTTPL